MTTIDPQVLDLGGEPDAAAFPPSMRLGAATASFQIEGAVDADGRGAEAKAGREAVRVAGVRQGSGGRHPFTAPAVMPFTSQRWVAKKAMSTGRVETTPAAISCAVLSW